MEKIFKAKIPYEKTLEIIRNLGNHIGLIMYLASYNYETTKKTQYNSVNKLNRKAKTLVFTTILNLTFYFHRFKSNSKNTHYALLAKFQFFLF